MEKFIYHKNDNVELMSSDYEVEDILLPGYYTVEMVKSLMFSNPKLYKTKAPVLPNTAVSIAKDYVNFDYLNVFFSKESADMHKSLKMIHKMGTILHGKQGTGKTTTMNAIAQELQKNFNAIVIYVGSIGTLQYAIYLLEKSKKIKDCLSIIIFDECEKSMYSSENIFKKILDSDTSLNNNLFLFSTNYFESIPQTITNRPSRIKLSIEVNGLKEEPTIFKVLQGMNNNLEAHLKLDDVEMRDTVKELVGKTLDEVKNLFLDKVFHINMSKVFAVKNLIKA